MYALLFVAVLASSGPELSPDAAIAGLPPPVHGLAVHSPQPRATIRPFTMPDRAVASLFDATAVTGLIPGAQEINDWYQHNKADRRWHNGVGLTVNFGFQPIKLTFGLGPVQFSLGGKSAKPVP